MSWNSPAFVIWRRNFLRTFSNRSFSPSVTSIEPPQRTRTRAAAQVLGVSLWIAVHGLPPCDRLPKLRLVAGRRQGTPCSFHAHPVSLLGVVTEPRAGIFPLDGPAHVRAAHSGSLPMF